jgi:hypothetical protein
MTLLEAVLKLTHECPYCDITKKFPSMRMFIWCNREHDIIELVTEREEDFSAITKELWRIPDIVEESSDRGNIHLITKTCSCDAENSADQAFGLFHLIHVSPLVIQKGWEYYRLIAFAQNQLKRLLNELEKRGFSCELVRKVPFDGFLASSLTLTADALFSDLTKKQVDALLTAYNYGYFKAPRRADVKTIAETKRIPRTTFQEHLQKAENKLVASLAPYVQLFRNIPPERRRLFKMV